MRIKTTIRLSDLCFYIFLFLIMIYYAFRKTTVNYQVLNFTLILAVPFALCKIALEKYSLREFCAIGILVGLGGISAVIIKNTSILVAFFIVIAMKNIDYITALKIVFYIRLISCIGILLGVALGIVENGEFVREAGDTNIRYSMGYVHPNTFGIYIFDIISLWFILYGKTKWKLKLLTALGVNLFCYLMTNSRTSFLLNLMYLMLVVLVNVMKDRKKLKFMAKFSFPLCFGANLLMPLTLGTGFGQTLNRLLSSRVGLSESYLRVYGIGLLGKPIQDVMTSYMYWHLDSGYLNLFIQFGAVIGVICMVLYYHAGKTDYKNKYIYLSIIGFAFYGIIEDVISSFLYNYLWIILGKAFYDMLEGDRKNSFKKLTSVIDSIGE